MNRHYREEPIDIKKTRKADRPCTILGSDIKKVVSGAWLPDALIKDMAFGHVFKNSLYKDAQIERFTLSKETLKSKIRINSAVAAFSFDSGS